MSWETQLERVNKAFSKQSAGFDAEDAANPILVWMRERVRAQVHQHLVPGSHILELNAGTGLDSLYFIEKGYKVHATDISEGMLAELNRKAAHSPNRENLKIERRSFTDLAGLPEVAYNGIFSNFGGLNCTDDLKAVVAQLPRLLKPGGVVTWVVMPYVSPWELVVALKGQLKLAFRRFARKGAWAHLEGVHFKTYYYNPKELISYFGKDFTVVGWQALGSLVPPPHMVNFPKRFPSLFRRLTRLEEKWGDKQPFRSWTDHYILSLRYTPKTTEKHD